MSDWDWGKAFEQGFNYVRREPEYFDVTCAECGRPIGTMKRYWSFPDMSECYELEDGGDYETLYDEEDRRWLYFHPGCYPE